MLAIKKVEVVPLAENEGEIIDSFNTQDDKHTNAPSLNAVSSITGNLSNLTTSNKDNLVSATNEIKTVAASTITSVGDLLELNTTDKSNIVNAVNCIAPTILYENASGSNTNITLEDSAANYSYIEIYYTDNQKSMYSSKKIDNPDGKGIVLDFISNYKNSSGLFSYLYIKKMQINGNTITKDLETYLQINNTTVNTVYESDYIYITKVVGYK